MLTLPPPALSMETSSMDLNHGTVAPHQPNKGARCPGLHALRVFPLFGASKWRPSKIWKTGRAPVLDGCCSMSRCNNQPNNNVGGGMDFGEAFIMGKTRGGRWLLIAFFGEWSDKKIKIERVMGPRISMAFSGWEDTTTSQKAALTLGYNMERWCAGWWQQGRTLSSLFSNRNLVQKNKYKKIHRAFRRPPIHATTNQIYARLMGGR